MTHGKISEGFELLPSIGLTWYTYKNKTHYYVCLRWLFWYITTLKKFKWEE